MDIKILNQILHIAFEKKVSDLHFEVDNPPFFRGRGQLVRSKLPNLTPQDTEFIATRSWSTTTAPCRTISPNWMLPSPCRMAERFRGSIFRQRGHIGIVMRVIPPHVGTFQELNLPPVLGEIATAPNGLILVTGSTGNGKSTTLASIIQYLNDNFNFNIITIEDPIEFFFTSSKSCIIQREVGARYAKLFHRLAGRPADGPGRHHGGGDARSGNHRCLHQGSGNRPSGSFYPPYHWALPAPSTGWSATSLRIRRR